jgi:hypothetical protein
VWGPPLSAEDFLRGEIVAKENITEERKKAIRSAIQSESAHKGEISLRERFVAKLLLLRREGRLSDVSAMVCS